MGQNNRQHRAAKAKRRRQRGGTQTRTHPRTGDAGQARGSSSAPLGAEQRRQHALDALSELKQAAAVFPAASLRFAVHRTLSALEPAVLVEVESLLAAELMARVAAVWEHGWQPQDLHHGTAKRGARQGVLAAELISQHAWITGARRRAPQAWRDQIDRISAAACGHPTAGEWQPVARLVAQNVAWATAWAEALGLLETLTALPPLPLLMPPPSQWDRVARPPRPTGSPERDRVLARIRALLAKAEVTNYPAEAEAFTAKAQELMSRHAIDEALLHAHDEESIAVLTQRVHLWSPYASTKVLLLSAVAQANRSRAIYLEEYAIASVVGTPVDVDQIELLYTSLLIQATRAMSAAGKHWAGSFDRSPTFRRSFLTSYATRIGERLTEADRETAASYGAELVPVLQRQATAVDAEFARQFPHTTTMNTGSVDPRGWRAGREAADRAIFVAGRLGG